MTAQPKILIHFIEKPNLKFRMTHKKSYLAMLWIIAAFSKSNEAAVFTGYFRNSYFRNLHLTSPKLIPDKSVTLFA